MNESRATNSSLSPAFLIIFKSQTRRIRAINIFYVIDFQLDFWNFPSVPRKSIAIHANHDAMKNLTKLLTVHGFSYEMIVENLQDLLHAEKRRVARDTDDDDVAFDAAYHGLDEVLLALSSNIRVEKGDQNTKYLTGQRKSICGLHTRANTLVHADLGKHKQTDSREKNDLSCLNGTTRIGGLWSGSTIRVRWAALKDIFIQQMWLYINFTQNI